MDQSAKIPRHQGPCANTYEFPCSTLPKTGLHTPALADTLHSMSRLAPCIGLAIVSYNTRELLRDCLNSLGNCSLPLRIVVVDNQSRDGSAEMVRSSFAQVELIEPGQNLGFAGGTNIALRHLLALEAGKHCEYLLLLNSDTIVHAGAIETLLAFLEAHPRVGMVGPRLLNTDGSVQAAAFRFPTLSMSMLDLFPPGEVLPGRLYGSWWHGRYPQEGIGSTPFPIDHPLGACILVRRSVIKEIGLLDEGYFCLLYTSPSPRDGLLSRMPSSA